MSDTAGPTSASRIATILEPAFAEGLEDLETDEIRRRRDEALAEREFQSYLRRLIQVRQAIVAAERVRRNSGAELEPLIERLTSVLTEGPKAGRSRGEALRMTLSEADTEEARRQVESLLGEGAMLNAEDLDEQQLDDTLANLAEAERRVSSDRGAVMRVHDRLQEELKRRYRDDPTQIPREL
jgi:vacuolar-type H+-ATPase subunit I/STV1